MKKYLLSIVALFATISVMAQQEIMMQPIPQDKDVRVGRLENGMTYYIRHNEKPKNMAEFWILYDVGAIQEDDDQQGLAHFLEHMAFNGTKNLPGKELIKYCERIGVAFGRNLNAATSWDQTTYNLSDVPVKNELGEVREDVIDSALLILHDWSHFISLNGEEIDNERGVIMEELRTRDGASWRSTMKLIEALGKGTRYEHRNLIGHLDGLASFPHEALRNFYEKWYRPEYQAFFVVGDVDVDLVEQKIKALMADVPASPADAAQKDEIIVPENEEPIISILLDPEMQQSEATLFVKHRARPENVNSLIVAEYIDIVDSYLGQMANSRLQEIAMKPDAPFLSAYIHNGSVGIIPTLETAMLGVTSKEGALTEAFANAMVELERMRRHGFTAGEFERAKANLMSSGQRQWANRNDRMNSSFIRRYMANYQKNSPIPDADTEWQLDSMLINVISVEMVNARMQELFTNSNQVVTVNAPQKEGLENPTEEIIAAILKQIPALPAEAIEPYADDMVKEPLIDPATRLKGSPVKYEGENEDMGTIEWVLKNGTRIIIKPTKFKADEIQLYVEAKGGAAMIEDPVESAIAANFLAGIRAFSGVSKFSSTELRKQLSGINASVSPFIQDFAHGLRGNSSPKDLETLMQLVYLNFTAPRFDFDDYDTFYNQYKSYLENMGADPNYIFQKSVVESLYSGNERTQVISLDLLNKINFSRLGAINAQLYPDANDFTFTFVGNVDLETLKPLVEKYIGSIPTSKKSLKLVDDGRAMVKGEVVNDFKTVMQQPKVGIFVVLSGEMEYSLKNSLTMTLLTQALSSRYLETIREQMGATYGVSCFASIDYEPRQEFAVQIVCDTNEQQADDVVKAMIAEIEKIAAEGPLAEDIEKTREFLAKDHRNNLEQNGSWISYLNRYYSYKTDWVNGYEEALQAITYDDVKALAEKVLSSGNVLKVIMRPEVTAAE